MIRVRELWRKGVSAETEGSNMICVGRKIGELCLKYAMYVCNDEEPGTINRNSLSAGGRADVLLAGTVTSSTSG
jgi:hypothetical protein